MLRWSSVAVHRSVNVNLLTVFGTFSVRGTTIDPPGGKLPRETGRTGLFNITFPVPASVLIDKLTMETLAALAILVFVTWTLTITVDPDLAVLAILAAKVTLAELSGLKNPP